MSKKSLKLIMSSLTILHIGISIIIISAICIGHIYQENKKEILNRLEQNLEQINDSLNEYTKDVIQVQELLQQDTRLIEAVNDYESKELSRIINAKSQIDYTLNNAVNLSVYIDNICIYANGRTFSYGTYNTYNYTMYAKNIPNEKWFKDVVEGRDDNQFIANYKYVNPYNGSQKNSYISVSAFGKNTVGKNNVIVITLAADKINKILDQREMLYDADFALYDISGNAVYTAGNHYKINENEIENTKTEGISHVTLGGTKYYLLEKYNKAMNLQLYSLVPTERILGELLNMLISIIIAAISILVLGVLTSLFSFYKLMRPIEDLACAMKDVEDKKFETIQNTSKAREIYKVVDTYNHMVKKIEELIHDVKKKEQEKRYIEYQVLQAQINPHFIYNTLDSIKWFALLENSPQIAQKISDFVKLLQLSLSSGKEMIYISQEIELVQSYIELMQFRNNYKLNVTYEVSEETYNLHTLKLILQPFVENCLEHAFRAENSNNSIVIRAYLWDDNVNMEVEDNGVGMSKEDVQRKGKLFSGIGIFNTEERIQLWHGEDYGIKVISEEGKNGTCIRIIQPKLK